jgi:glycosyltransferase involved in cell wall biosynthesis
MLCLVLIITTTSSSSSSCSITFIKPKAPDGEVMELGMNRTVQFEFEIRDAESLHGDVITIESELGVAGNIPIQVNKERRHVFQLSNLKLGTHYISAYLPQCESSGKIPFDLIPSIEMTRALRPQIGSVRSIPPYVSSNTKPIHVALVASLSNDGQNHLMLQQLRGLSLSSKFRVTIMYSKHLQPQPRPLLPYLEEFRSFVNIETYDISADSNFVESVGGIEKLTVMLERANDLKELSSKALEPLESMMKLFRDNVDIVSFVHVPENDVVNRFIVQAARLAGVKHILCEPGKWAKSEIWNRRGVTGIIAPSRVACVWWNDSNHVPPCWPISPGVAFVKKNVKKKSNEREKIIIAWIARIAPIKTPGLFVRFAERMIYHHHDVEFEFVMIGDGPIRNIVEGMVKDSNVSFRGWISKDDVVKTLTSGGIDLVVHTAFEETFGMSNLQVMMSGVPLVTVGTAGVLEYIPEGSCVPGVTVLDSFEPDAIVRTVENVLLLGANDCIDDGVGDKGGDLSSFWSEGRVGREYVRLYEWLMRS